MSKKPFPNCFTLGEVEGFRIVFEMHLRDIAQVRKATGEPYPQEMKALLDAALKPPYVDKGGDFVASDDRINGVRKHPVSLWVAERCHQDVTLECAWSAYVSKTGGLAAWAQPEAVQKLMRQERAWRFWGQYVLTCYKLLSSGAALRIPKTVETAAIDFVDGATKTCNALSALLADARVLMAVCPQEVPTMRVLRQALPDLIATFDNIDITKLYPYKNMRADAKSRTVAHDVAELAWRNLGHCDAGVLAEVLSDLDMPGAPFDDKWYGAQSGRAKEQVIAYEALRYEIHPRLPLNLEEDIYRPCPTDSPWLGTRRPARKGTVQRVF